MGNTAELINLSIQTDERGDLFALEALNPLPFQPKRVFVLMNLQPGTKRAGHAVSCHEFIVLLSGTCDIWVESIAELKCYTLKNRDCGLHISPGLKMTLENYSQDTLLLIACSEEYKDTIYYFEPKI